MFKNKFLIGILTAGIVLIIGINQFCLKEKSTTFSGFSDKAVVYTISSSGEYPRFLKAIIDPEDVKPGDIQKMLVEVESPGGIKEIKAEIEHDEGIDKLTLALKDGDEKHGQWFGIWEVHSTHSETYRTTFIAKDKTGKTNKIVLAWTDACALPRGGNWTLDGNCAISGVNGVDNGNFTVDGGYTLTINADGVFAWNSGKTITITNGSIAISNGGQLKQTNLWMIDGDIDDYPSSATQYAQDTAPTSGRRRYLVTQTSTDCNDSDNTKYQNLTGYTDADGDNYGTGSSQQICSGASLPSGYASQGGDCCDTDANAKPGQTSYFTSTNACGSWDYDCDSSISKSSASCGYAASCSPTGSVSYCSAPYCRRTYALYDCGESGDKYQCCATCHQSWPSCDQCATGGCQAYQWVCTGGIGVCSCWRETNTNITCACQ